MNMTPAQRNTPITSIDTEHMGMINDIQLDYYGKRLATCSADRTFRIYDVSPAISTDATSGNTKKIDSTESNEPSTHTLQAVVQLPEDSVAPIHRIAWAHPKYGSLLALGCQDGFIYIYRDEQQFAPDGTSTSSFSWQLKYMQQLHGLSITSIAWAPYEYGLCLASSSADGYVSLLTRMKEGWFMTSSFMNTQDGSACTAVSWAPYNSLGSQTSEGPIQRVVTGSCNHSVQIWQRSRVRIQNEADASQEQYQETWSVVTSHYAHHDWVRDVAWAPNVGIPANVIASASDDHTVQIWNQNELDGEWTLFPLPEFSFPVYRLSWSLTGMVLSVAAGDNEITFWKQISNEKWQQISSMNDQGVSVNTP